MKPNKDEAKKKEKDCVSELFKMSCFISKKLRVSSRLSLLLLCLVCVFALLFTCQKAKRMA